MISHPLSPKVFFRPGAVLGLNLFEFGSRKLSLFCRSMYDAAVSVYCEICELCLNGPAQWEDHKVGNCHKKNLKRVEMSLPMIRGRRKRKNEMGKGDLIPLL